MKSASMADHDDKAEILEILNLYGFALDAHQWQLFDRIFTEDVIAEFGPAGAAWKGLAEFKRSFADFHDRLDSHQHTMMGQLVHVDGDKANAFSYGNRLLVREAAEGGSSWLGTGWYDDELIRTDQGWRIQHRVCRLQSWSGNPYVPEQHREHNPDMWITAAEQPPHLAAINPWEGFSDVYRDLVMPDGMPDIGFAERLQLYSYAGQNQREDILAQVERYPLMNDLWEDKIPQFEKITMPAYVVASFSSTLHTKGTFRAWRRISSEEKWPRIHDSQEWPDYYDEASVEDLRRFFDHYLKGENNGWEQTPSVRYSILDLEGGNRVNQPAGEFPPADAVDTKYYLHGRWRTLATEPPAQEMTVTYDTESNPGLVSFTVRFTRRTTLVGYPKARLWVEAKGADDMDLFVLVQKLNAHGTHLQEFTIPNQSAMVQDLTERGASVLRYKGADGRLRVSARHLDEALSTDSVPAHSFDRVEKLQPGEIVAIEIDLAPVGLAFYAGEQLRFVVSAHNLLGAHMPATRDYIPRNSGTHVIHTGGAHASYLQLPVLNANGG